MKFTQRLFLLVFSLLVFYEASRHLLEVFISDMEPVMNLLKPFVGFLFVLGALIIYRKNRTAKANK